FHRTHVLLGRDHVELFHVRAEQLRLVLRQNLPVHSGGVGTFQQRIIDVRHVLHVVHSAAGIAPVAVEQVERHVGGGVAHVGGIVRGNAADVEASGGGRFQRNQRPHGGVVDGQFVFAARNHGYGMGIPTKHS